MRPIAAVAVAVAASIALGGAAIAPLMVLTFARPPQPLPLGTVQWLGEAGVTVDGSSAAAPSPRTAGRYARVASFTSFEPASWRRSGCAPRGAIPTSKCARFRAPAGRCRNVPLGSTKAPKRYSIR